MQALDSVWQQPDLPFSVFAQACLKHEDAGSGRKRDLFPVPLLGGWPDSVSCPRHVEPVCYKLLNACISALNFLAVDFKLERSRPTRLEPTASQLRLIEHVASRCTAFLERLSAQFPAGFHWNTGFRKFEAVEQTRGTKLEADAVDIPARAGTCDASDLISQDLFNVVSNAHNLFSEDLSFTVRARGPVGRDRQEYIKLVHRQLVCGKVCLRRCVRAVADVFTVPKSTPGRQREVWNGSLISEAAATPPKPRLLANPACFVDIHAKSDEPLFFSKRDVSTCFDVIKAPDSMQEWFGQPPVTLRELVRASGHGLEQLRSFIVDDQDQVAKLDTFLFPASTVWRMGFSWSSAIAQECTVSCCLRSGVPESVFLCMEQPLPLDQSELCGVATDDTIFIHRSKSLAKERLQRLDAEMAKAGMPKNAAKDVDWMPKMAALGCELTAQPLGVEPNAAKLFSLFAGFIGLLLRPAASPKALSRALGVAQWFCLLQRPLFSVFSFRPGV